jgi:hypothetical protein
MDFGTHANQKSKVARAIEPLPQQESNLEEVIANTKTSNEKQKSVD